MQELDSFRLGNVISSQPRLCDFVSWCFTIHLLKEVLESCVGACTSMKTITTGLIPIALITGLGIDAVAQPVITRQPTNISVSLGASATFQVSATSTNPPILVQWRFVSTNLEAKTNLSLNLTNIQLLNAGDYDAVLTDSSTAS